MKEIKRTKTITLITNAVMALIMFATLMAMMVYGSKIGIDPIYAILVAAVFIFMYLYFKSIDISNKYFETLMKEGIDPEKI